MLTSESKQNLPHSSNPSPDPPTYTQILCPTSELMLPTSPLFPYLFSITPHFEGIFWGHGRHRTCEEACERQDATFCFFFLRCFRGNCPVPFSLFSEVFPFYFWTILFSSGIHGSAASFKTNFLSSKSSSPRSVQFTTLNPHFLFVPWVCIHPLPCYIPQLHSFMSMYRYFLLFKIFSVAFYAD